MITENFLLSTLILCLLNSKENTEYFEGKTHVDCAQKIMKKIKKFAAYHAITYVQKKMFAIPEDGSKANVQCMVCGDDCT